MQAARVLSLLLLSTTLAAQAPPPAYDIVIRNGRVLDGAYNPWITDDVAILNGHFVKIGHVTGHGRRESDATGKYVRPAGST